MDEKGERGGDGNEERRDGEEVDRWNVEEHAINRGLEGFVVWVTFDEDAGGDDQSHKGILIRVVDNVLIETRMGVGKERFLVKRGVVK
nr:hypothetical protein Iba_scaffold2300CG0950 [Ipomoea batatas]